jgi:hypothetical protein
MLHAEISNDQNGNKVIKKTKIGISQKNSLRPLF